MSDAALVVDGPAALTAGWLTKVLSYDGVDVVVDDVEVSVVGAGQMASCYRMVPTYGDRDGPASLVVKLPSDDPEVRTAVASAYRTEVGFYRELAPRLPLASPRCYLAATGEDGIEFSLVLEDLASSVPGDQIVGCTADQAQAAAVGIAGLHAGSWCDEGIRGLDWLIPPSAALAEHIDPILPGLVSQFLGRRSLSPAAADVLAQFAEGFVVWGSDLSGPWSLVHNDHRLDNLLFGADGAGATQVVAVDWQSLSTGPPLRDVAFLLGTGLAPDVRRSTEREIVDRYHAELVGHGVTDYSIDRCWLDYRRAMFHGPFICVMGEAFAATSDRGTEMFTAMLERAAAAIVDLDAFSALEAAP